MKFTVKTLELAEKDVAEIHRWLVRRSVKGAWSWFKALEDRLDRLSDDADGCANAREARRLRREIRETYFKTRYGHRYRLVFTIVANEVRILRVRAFGQRLLRKNELPLDEESS